jgi:hypothetical protein
VVVERSADGASARAAGEVGSGRPGHRTRSRRARQRLTGDVVVAEQFPADTGRNGSNRLAPLGLKSCGERLGKSLKDRGEQKWLGLLGRIETEAVETTKDLPDGQVAACRSDCRAEPSAGAASASASALRWCRLWTLATPRWLPDGGYLARLWISVSDIHRVNGISKSCSLPF